MQRVCRSYGVWGRCLNEKKVHVLFYFVRWKNSYEVVAIRSSKKNMKSYQTLKTHSHSSNTPIRLPERCSVAPSKKIFSPHAHLAGTIFIFQMGMRAKDIIIQHHYWHPHDVIAGLRAKNGAVDAVSCAWMWNRDFPYKMPRFSTFYFQVWLKSYLNVSTSRILWYDFILWFNSLQRVSHD